MRPSLRMISVTMMTTAIAMAGTFSALAHVSEQGIVLLLPTNTYILSGCLAVISSMIIVTALPHANVFALFATRQVPLGWVGRIVDNQLLRHLCSLFSLCLLMVLVTIGVTGTRDPLTNLLPLTIWTFFWILLFMLHCIMGNLWRWMNPWTGIWRLVFGDPKAIWELPKKIGQWPAILIFILFYMFIIVDLAPDDPARLARVVFGYVSFNFIGMYLFGSKPWLAQVECFSVLFTLLSRLAPLRYDEASMTWRLGLPGWKCLAHRDQSLSQAFFLLTVLACGSFDGLNETFWWLAQIDINPLAFPGRSAVVWPSTMGMIGAVLTVYLIFSLVIWCSFRLVRTTDPGASSIDYKYSNLFSSLALTILPITAVYHGSHYLLSYLVNSQYLVAALSDPLANGSNLLGLHNYQVTTGYLGEVASVRRIWLTQATMVVSGHIIAVLMAHHIIAKAFVSRKQAIIFHIPIAIFMALYTWFGLWLLAAPKGA